MQVVDASIPLSVKPVQLDTPIQAYGRMMNLKALQQRTQLGDIELAQNMQNLRDQQQLSVLAAEPGNLDPKTGMFTPEALTKVTNPILRQKLNQTRMGALKDQSEIDWKTSEVAKNADAAKTNALHGVMEEAYSTYEDTRKRTGNEQAATDAFNKALAGGYEDLKATGRGGFSKDTQFKMLSPQEVGAKLITHKERVTEEAATARGEEDPFIKETKYAEKLKGDLAELAPGDPASASIKAQIAKVEGHLARLDRMPGTGGEGGKAPAGYRWKADGSLEPIPGGPATKDKRDVMQADALAAYRARYPYGYMPDMYGKTQPTPDDFTAFYIKKKETEAKPAAAGAPKPAAGAKPKVGTKAEFDALPKGTIFIDSRDGKEKVKG